MADIERIDNKQLLMLSKTGSLCEVCSNHMHNHNWADMDIDGFVTACSFSTGEQKPNGK